MKKCIAFLSLFVALISMSFINKSYHEPVKDYLNVSGPILFNGDNYNLSWSSHPIEALYKQEYIVTGDNPDKYKSMVMIDLVTGTDDVKAVLKAKVAEIELIKKSNPVVQYEVMENKGEYMLDFLLSENTPDGKLVATVERNVYRYKKFKDKSGKKGVLLFGISVRSYGNDIDDFFAKLKTNRYDLINALGQCQIPEVSLIN
jgi:hypothetical protein